MAQAKRAVTPAHVYRARDLAAMDRPALWALVNQLGRDTPIQVEFDDGVLQTNIHQTLFSAYCWGIYNLYPRTPTSIRHHLNNGKMRNTTHTDLMNKVLWDCFDAYFGNVDLEALWKFIYDETNRLYNDFTYGCEAYVQTMTVFDFTDIASHPGILEAKEKTRPSAHSIESVAYTKAREILNDPAQLPFNQIARAVSNGLLSMGQVLQCTVARGAAADVDSTIFQTPIMSNFTDGMNSLYESIVESRSAAKSLTFNEDHLRKVEYFNRKVQLMASVILRLHRADCGTTQYMPWVVHSKDLSKMVGVYYWDPETRGLKAIRDSDTHLVGKQLQLRSPLYCAHKDPQGVCSTCIGEISYSIPDGTNPGDFMARCLGEEAAQTVLSTKHLDGNAAGSRLDISPFEEQFIAPGSEDNTIVIADRLKGKSVKIVLRESEAQGIAVIDFESGVRIDLLQTSQISELSEVLFLIGDGRERTTETISVSSGSLRSSLSHEMLAYVRDHGWELDEHNNFVIDLKDWNFAQSAFVVPNRSENMLDIIKNIESFMRASTTSGGSGREDSDGKAVTLRTIKEIPVAMREFYELVTSNLSMNLPHLAVLLKSTMIRSSKHRDYRPPLLGNQVEFGAFDVTMERRSAAAAMAFERHHQMLTSPTSYIIKNRPDSLYDPLLE